MTAPHEPAPAPPFTPPPAPPKKRRWGLIIGIVVAAIVAVIVLFIVAAVLLFNSSTKDAQKVSDQFVAAVQAGDGAKAYSLTGPAFRAATKQDQLDQLVQQLSTLVTKDKVSPSGKAISASTENGKIAVFTYTLKGTGGASVYFKTQIRDEDGGWQVMNFRSSEKELDTKVE